MKYAACIILILASLLGIAAAANISQTTLTPAPSIVTQFPQPTMTITTPQSTIIPAPPTMTQIPEPTIPPHITIIPVLPTVTQFPHITITATPPIIIPIPEPTDIEPIRPIMPTIPIKPRPPTRITITITTIPFPRPTRPIVPTITWITIFPIKSRPIIIPIKTCTNETASYVTMYATFIFRHGGYRYVTQDYSNGTVTIKFVVFDDKPAIMVIKQEKIKVTYPAGEEKPKVIGLIYHYRSDGTLVRIETITPLS